MRYPTEGVFMFLFACMIIGGIISVASRSPTKPPPLNPWEMVINNDHVLERIRVPGGWIYRQFGVECVALTFVPDPTLPIEEDGR